MTRLSKQKPLEETLSNIVDFVVNKPYTATTSNVQITVWPEFIDSKSSAIGDLFIWAYHVRIDNRNTESLKLISRYWRIIDEKGIIQEVNGEGIVGEQPIITPGASYQYSSGVHLRYPSGIMTGQYKMQKLGTETIGETFDVKIPNFSLDVPSIKNVLN
jgi:ApaG protein